MNGNITKTTAQQLFHARLTAGDPEALEVAAVCEAALVEVVRRNLMRGEIKRGHTYAVGAITRCIASYGRDTTITALQCITQTSDGNAGFVRATVVTAICEVLHENLVWRDPGEALLRAMDDFDFGDAWEIAMAGRHFILSAAVKQSIRDQLIDHLSTRLQKAAA